MKLLGKEGEHRIEGMNVQFRHSPFELCRQEADMITP